MGEIITAIVSREQFEKLKNDPNFSVIDPESREALRLCVPTIEMTAEECIKYFSFTDKDRVL